MQRLKSWFNWAQTFVAGRGFLYFIYALFVIQTGFLAIVTKFSVPPDEKNQIDFIEYYAHHSLSPFLQHQMPTENLGDITRQVDFVYHYAMSLVMRISPLPDHYDLYVIRFFSIGFAVITFVLLLRMLRELHVSRAASHLGLFALMNLPMVLMMSSAVNADVLVWLGTVSGIYLMLRIWKYHQPSDVLFLLIVAIYGGIIKRTLFPICLIFGVTALVMVARYWHDLKSKVRLRSWRQIVLIVLLVIGVGLFVERVGGNLYQYHTVSPSCTQVQGDGPCSVYWLHNRKTALDSDIDSATEYYLGDGASVDRTLAPLPTFFVKWNISNFDNLVDIQTQGWKHTMPPPWWLGGGLLILVTVTLIYGLMYEIKHLRAEEMARWRLIVIGFAVFIVGTQFVVNYGTYVRSHVFGLALNGRYILPALMLLIGLCAWYGRKLFGRIAGPVLITLVLIGIIGLSGLIMMVRNPQLFFG